MGATLLDGVVVEKHAMVAAGSLVKQDTRVPSGEVYLSIAIFPNFRFCYFISQGKIMVVSGERVYCLIAPTPHPIPPLPFYTHSV